MRWSWGTPFAWKQWEEAPAGGTPGIPATWTAVEAPRWEPAVPGSLAGGRGAWEARGDTRPDARLGRVEPTGERALADPLELDIPVRVDEADRLRKAQLARGADFSGGPIRRARSLIPLLVPLFVSAFDRADRLALAMESRCYRGGVERTSFHVFALGRGDLLTALTVAATALTIAVLPRFWPF